MPDKFEREIEDILNKLDKFPKQGPGIRVRRAVTRRMLSFQRGIAVWLARLSVNQIMLSGIGLILVGFFFRAGLPGIWSYIITLGLILFFAAFVLSFFGGGRGSRSGQIYWRGRPSSYYSDGPSLPSRLLQWWRRRQGGKY